MTKRAHPQHDMCMSKAKHFAGLDIGGSTIKSVIINSSGDQVGPIVEVKSLVKEGYRATFKQLEAALDELTKNAGIDRKDIGGIGLDVPAPSSNGVIWGKANLGDDWVGTDICTELKKHLNIPVHMTNDCNAAAVGEYAIRHKHLGSLLLVAPGTGLGGGFVLPGGNSTKAQTASLLRSATFPSLSPKTTAHSRAAHADSLAASKPGFLW